MSDKKKDDELVNPKHYSDFGNWSAVVIIRVWNRIRKAAGVEPVSFAMGNALKYMQRAGFKPGEQEIVDVKKAIWYLQEHVFNLDPENEFDPAA